MKKDLSIRSKQEKTNKQKNRNGNEIARSVKAIIKPPKKKKENKNEKTVYLKKKKAKQTKEKNEEKNERLSC